jgi:uncharacterized protein YukE
LQVDPAALVQVAQRLQERADAMRSGAPLLQEAWVQGALALAAERTGDVLAETRPGSAAALEEFAASVESLAQALRRGAQSYEATEATVSATATAAAAGRVGAWIR